MNRLHLLLVCLLLTACGRDQAAVAPIPTGNPTQSIIFHNGVILTMDSDQPIVEAIVIRGEKIEALGSDEEILALRAAGTMMIDLGGRTLMPGFVDAHTHVLNDARSLGLSLDQAQYQALRYGITTLGDLYIDEPFLREIQAFANRGELRVRTSLYLVANTNCGKARGDWYKKYPPTRQPGEMLRIGGVKIFTDGGSCGGVALSFELKPGQGQGDLWLTQEKLNRMVSEAQADGYQVAIHAIGDRAVSQAQDAIALALGGGPNRYRHRIEHLSVLRPEMIPRFGELGIVPVLMGEYPACIPLGSPLPEGYHEWEWPWRELRAANPDLPIAWHSDYPYLSINPFVHLYGFITRNDVYQAYTCPAKDWLLDDTLTVQESLSIMTIESAYALFRDEEVGSLQPGKYADLIVISGNPLTVLEDKLKSLTVLATMVGGRFEYCDLRSAELCPAYQARTPLPLPDYRPAVSIRWLVMILALLLPMITGLWYFRPASRYWLRSLGGVAGILGGGLWIWVTSTGMNTSTDILTWPLLGAGTLIAIAIVGLASVERPNRLSGWGMGIAWLGMITLSISFILSFWFEEEAGWLLIMASLLIHIIGLIIMGVGNLRQKRLSPLHLLPLIIGLLAGLLPFALSFLAGDYGWPLTILGYGLGLGWMLMGLLTLTAKRDRMVTVQETL